MTKLPVGGFDLGRNVPPVYVAAFECPECRHWPIYHRIDDPLKIPPVECPVCHYLFDVAYDEGADNRRDMFISERRIYGTR